MLHSNPPAGGGAGTERESLPEPVRAHAEKEQYGHNPDAATKICKAQLGNDAGIIGAAMLGKEG